MEAGVVTPTHASINLAAAEATVEECEATVEECEADECEADECEAKETEDGVHEHGHGRGDVTCIVGNKQTAHNSNAHGMGCLI